ncbi:hypothetical protein DPEC_G00271340 [Dallia pectoralis]|uniref:Uncharacterized protein n=1 Tax=Dallia pectoralis TaxID=75939 RepID=A0ACC2FPU8_DALPE|nr:hypothetical protein DPEC_G00271340 [Dallia pectoralis]
MSHCRLQLRERIDRRNTFNRLVNSSKKHIIMETDQVPGKAAASCPAASQGPIKTGWLSSSKRGTSVAQPPSDVASRFQGDGVRYKAKLIGMDFVPAGQGEKMCLDSMMKLKGQEVAARNQGRHKQRVWLKVSSAAVKIMDERTGVVIQSHEPGNIHSLTKDESDPRAFSYIYNFYGSYVLFYIKMASLAAAVLDDIGKVCQSPIAPADIATEVFEPLPKSSALLLLDDMVASPKTLDDMDLFNPLPSSSPEQLKQISIKDELKDIFSFSSQDPFMDQSGSPQFSPASQKCSALPGLPVTGLPSTSPVSVTWGQQGPRPTLLPGSNGPSGGPALWSWQHNMTGWTSRPGGTRPDGGPPIEVITQPGVMWGQSTMSCPFTAAPTYTFYGAEGHQQPVSPTTYTTYRAEGHQQPVSPPTYTSYGAEGHQQPVSPTTYTSYGAEGHQQPVSPTTYTTYGAEGQQQPVSPTTYNTPAQR